MIKYTYLPNIYTYIIIVTVLCMYVCMYVSLYVYACLHKSATVTRVYYSFLVYALQFMKDYAQPAGCCYTEALKTFFADELVQRITS